MYIYMYIYIYIYIYTYIYIYMNKKYTQNLFKLQINLVFSDKSAT